MNAVSEEHEKEIKRGERFRFGKNWLRFLSSLDEQRISEAEKSLKQMLGLDYLNGMSFLDVGSGSGLFSLAARKLGARVRSFDFDPQSVACTKELKRRYFPDDEGWNIEEGSVLDSEYINSLGRFDMVYSWGVLHHTGDMWKALEHVSVPVGEGGRLFIAIYNDQGWKSGFWSRIKKTYCSGLPGRIAVKSLFIPFFIIGGLVKDIFMMRNPLKRYTEYKKHRGMSFYYDWFDWLGGYPFEVAAPGVITRFYEQKGFRLKKISTTSGWGNNQYVFIKEHQSR